MKTPSLRWIPAALLALAGCDDAAPAADAAPADAGVVDDLG
ncbi:MAG: hypothetical protein JWM10_4956, partial [Myxococcaceae bacterium]|nr:hypothetical protein [Myxococcaceae bacterium]